MQKIFFRLSCLLLIASVTTGCKKKQWDEYYGRPAGLEPPIYQTLTQKGEFTHLLAAIDKAGYKETLGAAGYWTLFAPNDSSFTVFFKERGVTGIQQLDSATCRQIVNYCLVFNGFEKSKIDDYQSNAGWIPNSAFKRRTTYYTGVYNDTNFNGTLIKAIASNRNNNGNLFYLDNDNNNKYITFFTDTFFRAKALVPADYNYFYPATSFTGFNVMDARVLEKDVPAENGVIHIINKVLVAQPSINEYITGKPEYSEFKKLLDKYLTQFVLNQNVTTRNQHQTGSASPVYTKVFSQALAFSPNNENFLKQQDNDGQSNGYTLFAPSNAALRDYINNVLLENYPSLDALPISVIYDFVNAHMWQSTVWPSKFNTTLSSLNEEARFNPATDVEDKKILSNGFFYGTKKVQEANVFSTVYGRVYLDPNYTMMQRLMDNELKQVVTNPSQRYTIFMMSNSVLNAAGFTIDPTLSNDIQSQWRYQPANGGAVQTGAQARARLLRLINTHVVPTPNNELNNLSGSGVAESYGGEFIRWENNKVMASGNLDSNTVVAISSYKDSKNGRVYYCDGLLSFSETAIGKHVEKLGTAAASAFNHFWQYLGNSSIYNTVTGEIQGVTSGTFYTLFVPDNAAIVAAVNAGLLPGTGTAPNMVPNFKPTGALEKEQVNNFILYHFLNKKSLATNGKESGSYETLLKTGAGDPTTIFVNNSTVNATRLTDMANRQGNLVLSKSNFLSVRCVIHLIDNYMKYQN